MANVNVCLGLQAYYMPMGLRTKKLHQKHAVSDHNYQPFFKEFRFVKTHKYIDDPLLPLSVSQYRELDQHHERTPEGITSV